MGKCLVTKLNGSTNNSDLLRIGEMRIKFRRVSDPTGVTQSVVLPVKQEVKLEIIGDGYFTDSSLSENKGKTSTITVGTPGDIYVSNSDIEVAVLNKYAIKSISVKSGYKGTMSFDIGNLEYSNSLTSIFTPNSQVSGDISAFKNLALLSYVFLENSKVYGDIAAFNDKTVITTLNMSNTNVSGDIANLKNLTALTNLVMDATQISGDIANLKNLTKLTFLRFKNVEGLIGDMGVLPDNILFFSGGKGNFTWNTSSRTYILATERVKCNKIDDMLNDMATKTAKFAGEQIWYKTISLIGTRTSASDAAVQTLQSKGYTVSITPA